MCWPYSDLLADSILVLKAMKRPWQPSHGAAARSHAAPSARGGAAHHFIRRFPGETEEQFEHPAGPCFEGQKFDNVGVFTYFPSRGNAAAENLRSGSGLGGDRAAQPA